MNIDKMNISRPVAAVRCEVYEGKPRRERI